MTYFIGVAGCMICLLEKSSITKTFIKFFITKPPVLGSCNYVQAQIIVVSFATPDSLLSPGRSY